MKAFDQWWGNQDYDIRVGDSFEEAAEDAWKASLAWAYEHPNIMSIVVAIEEELGIKDE